jgi:hypothetical protein
VNARHGYTSYLGTQTSRLAAQIVLEEPGGVLAHTAPGARRGDASKASKAIRARVPDIIAAYAALIAMRLPKIPTLGGTVMFAAYH